MKNIGIPLNIDSRSFVSQKSNGRTFLTRVATPFAIAALTVLSACSDTDSRGEGNSDTDVVERNRPDLIDSRSDAGNNEDITDSDIDDSEIDNGEEDVIDTDIPEEIIEEPRRSVLRVFNTAGDVNIIDGSTSSEQYLASFELCAIGDDVEVSLVTLSNMGDFYELRMSPVFGSESSEIVLSSFDATLTIDPSESVFIQDGDCEEVSITSDPANIDSFDKWIRFNLVNVEARGLDSDMRVVRGLDSIILGQRHPVRGVHTVLNLEDNISISANTIGASTDLVDVRRDERFFGIGSFTFVTNPNSVSELNEVRFGFNLNNPDEVLPVSSEFYLFDPIVNSGFNLAGDLFVERDGNRALINSSVVGVRDGDVLVWVPDEGSEDLSFGTNLNLSFTGLYAPSDLDGVRVSMIGVDTESEVSLRDSTWMPIDDFPLDWNEVRFVDPEVRGSVAIVNMQSFNPFRREHFVWRDDNGNVIRDGQCFDSNCRLFDGFVRFEGSLSRSNRTLLNSVSVVTKNDTGNNLNFVYRIISGEEGTASYAVHREGRFSVDRFSEGHLNLNDIAYELNNDNNQSFRIVVDIDDSDIPEIDKFDIDRNALQFVLEDIDITQGEESIPVLVNGRMPAGIGEFGEFELPYQMSDIHFNSPALLNTGSRITPVSVNERTYNAGESVSLFDSTFSNLHGGVNICRVFFQHDINKVSPPFNSLILNVAGNIAVLTSWSRDRAMFRFIDDGCPTIGEGQEFSVQMEGFNPIFAEIQNSLRGRFVLVGIQASTLNSDSYTVPVIADFDMFGSAIQLSGDNPIVGPMITISARN